MPIRSPRGRAAAYRAVWQWPLRSPARLVITLAVVLGVVIGVTAGLTAMSGPQPPGQYAAPSRTTAPTGSRSVAPTPTQLPPLPDVATTLPLTSAPAAALETAELWSVAWVRPPAGTLASQWLEGLRPYTSEEYLGVLAAVDPANIPATQVTGEAQPVQVSAGSVQVEVPTDAVTLVVLVVLTDDGWRVSGYDRAA